jgi:hypothetical protein
VPKYALTGASFECFRFGIRVSTQKPRIGLWITDQDWQARQGIYSPDSKYSPDQYDNDKDFEKKMIPLPEWTDSYVVKKDQN